MPAEQTALFHHWRLSSVTLTDISLLVLLFLGGLGD
jgi:hypothetical protein